MDGPKLFQLENRRRKVAAMYLRGTSQGDIAERLEVSVSTVERDLSIVRERAKLAAVRSIDEHKAAELETIDRIEREAWKAWKRSQKDAITVTRKEGDTKETTVRSQGQAGNPAWLDTVLKCVDRRCRLLGLDAPQQIDLNIHDMTDDELAEQERQLGIEPPRFVLPHMGQQAN